MLPDGDRRRKECHLLGQTAQIYEQESVKVWPSTEQLLTGLKTPLELVCQSRRKCDIRANALPHWQKNRRSGRVAAYQRRTETIANGHLRYMSLSKSYMTRVCRPFDWTFRRSRSRQSFCKTIAGIHTLPTGQSPAWKR